VDILIAFDVTEDFLINGTVRYEDYSDFWWCNCLEALDINFEDKSN
jgi:hypothetical protein